MNRAVVWILGSILVLAVLWLSIRPSFSGPKETPDSAASEVKQVAIAARSYANEHHGRLPPSLNELVPGYLPDDRLLAGTHFATPGAVLADLPKETIILFRVAIPAKNRYPYVVIAHPDGVIEWKKFVNRPAPRRD